MKRNLMLAGLLGAALLVAAGAHGKPVSSQHQASGTFASKTGDFEVVGAYAFPGKIGDGDEPGILVAVSNVVSAWEK